MLKRTVLFALMTVGLIGVGINLYAAGDLDGTQWKMREGKLPIGKQDTMKFESGNFTSVECIPYGFNGSPYESRQENGQIKWNATQKNNKGESMVWEGTVQPNGKMKGTYTYTDEKKKITKKNWAARKAS